MYKTKSFAARNVLAAYNQLAVFTAHEDGIT